MVGLFSNRRFGFNVSVWFNFMSFCFLYGRLEMNWFFVDFSLRKLMIFFIFWWCCNFFLVVLECLNDSLSMVVMDVFIFRWCFSMMLFRVVMWVKSFKFWKVCVILVVVIWLGCFLIKLCFLKRILFCLGLYRLFM